MIPALDKADWRWQLPVSLPPPKTSVCPTSSLRAAPSLAQGTEVETGALISVDTGEHGLSGAHAFNSLTPDSYMSTIFRTWSGSNIDLATSSLPKEFSRIF